MSMWSDFDLTDRQLELVGRATELGPAFAARAAEIDRDARFPHENYADMRDAGLLALCIPGQYGGLGADYRTYFLVASEIGRHCGATALTLNMHSCSMLWSGPLADDLPMTDEERRGHQERRAALYDLVLNERAIFAQPFGRHRQIPRHPQPQPPSTSPEQPLHSHHHCRSRHPSSHLESSPLFRPW